MPTGTNITGGALGNGPSLTIPTRTTGWQPPPERRKSYRPPGWDRLPAEPPTPDPAPAPSSRMKPAPRPRTSSTPNRPSVTRTRTPGQPSTRRDDLNPRVIVDAYLAGATIEALAREHGSTHSTIRNRLAAAGITIDRNRRGPRQPRIRAQYARPIGPNPPTQAQREQAARFIAARQAIAERAAAREARARRCLAADQAGARAASPEPAATPAPPAPSRPRIDHQPLIDAYANGSSVPEIAATHGLSVSTVRRAIVASGTPLRDDRATRSGRTQHTRTSDPAFLDDVVRLYTSGSTLDEIARQLGTGSNQVYRALVARGVARRPAKARTAVDGAAPLKDLMRAYDITAADVRAWAERTRYQPPLPARGLPPMFAVLAYALDTRSPS